MVARIGVKKIFQFRLAILAKAISARLYRGMPKTRKSLFDPNYILIVDGLIERRKVLGLSQWDMAVRLGEDQSWVSKIERKQRRMDAFEYIRFCRVLDLDPGEIMRPIWSGMPSKETHEN